MAHLHGMASYGDASNIDDNILEQYCPLLPEHARKQIVEMYCVKRGVQMITRQREYGDPGILLDYVPPSAERQSCTLRGKEEKLKSPDGKFEIGSLLGGSSIHVKNSSTGKSLWLRGKEGDTGPKMNAACWSPDSQFVAAGSEHGAVRIYDMESETSYVKLDSCGSLYATCDSIAWSPDGKHISAVYSNILTIFNVASGHRECARRVDFRGNHEWSSDSKSVLCEFEYRPDESLRLKFHGLFAVRQWAADGCPPMKGEFSFVDETTGERYVKPTKKFSTICLVEKLLSAVRKTQVGLSGTERAYWHCLPHEVQTILERAIKRRAIPTFGTPLYESIEDVECKDDTGDPDAN